jgi:hypothetical protein
MKSTIKHSLCAVAASVALASGAVQAAEPYFTVDESIQGSGGNVTANRIQGEYSEVANFNLDSTFDVSILFNLNSFVDTGPAIDPGSALGAGDYNLYATFLGGGTFGPQGSGTKFTFTSGSFNLFMDFDADSTFGDITTQNANALWSVTENNADGLIASGNILSGVGILDPVGFGSACTQQNICGSFGTNTDFSLTALGLTYFVDPDPFYDLTFESGTLRNFTVAGRQEITGDGSIWFGETPEPGTIALFGLGLLGLSRINRRKR